ncbi:MAG: tetratricopeptide repeat protein [Alteromonadaceae bacterium]|nr:tetratricopeptide repeat protein [Alteromonadaceae bacterium]
MTFKYALRFFIHLCTGPHNLAGLYESMGDYDRALPLYLRSLDIKEKVLGAEHPAVATSLNNLAGLYESTGDTDRALPLYQRSIDILEKVLGSEHPSTITVKENMNKLVLKLK